MFFIGENKKILRHVQNYFNSISTEDIELQEEVERLDTAIIEAEEEHAKYEKRWNRKSDVVFYLFLVWSVSFFFVDSPLQTLVFGFLLGLIWGTGRWRS